MGLIECPSTNVLKGENLLYLPSLDSPGQNVSIPSKAKSKGDILQNYLLPNCKPLHSNTCFSSEN